MFLWQAAHINNQNRLSTFIADADAFDVWEKAQVNAQLDGGRLCWFVKCHGRKPKPHA